MDASAFKPCEPWKTFSSKLLQLAPSLRAEHNRLLCERLGHHVKTFGVDFASKVHALGGKPPYIVSVEVEKTRRLLEDLVAGLDQHAPRIAKIEWIIAQSKVDHSVDTVYRQIERTMAAFKDLHYIQARRVNDRRRVQEAQANGVFEQVFGPPVQLGYCHSVEHLSNDSSLSQILSPRDASDAASSSNIGDAVLAGELRDEDEDLEEVDNIIQLLQRLPQSERETIDVQHTVESLDKRLAAITSGSNPLSTRLLRRLQALCRYARFLPAGCFIQEHIRLAGSKPVVQSALSDIYMGQLGNTCVAVKIARVRIDNEQAVFKAFYSEVAVWRWLRHPNIVALLGVSNQYGPSLVSQWMVNGTVKDYISNNPQIPKTKFIKDAVQGLRYLRTINLIHGDLKAANILVNDHGDACLTDFGLSNPIQSTIAFTGTASLRGTLRWMAPELLDVEDDEETVSASVTPQSDVYALAMTMWEIFTGKWPFHNITREAAIIGAVLKCLRPKRPLPERAPELSDGIWSIMEQCWAANPAKRLELDIIQSALA